MSKAHNNMHDMIIDKVAHAPVNLYFDKRSVSRVTSDINCFESFDDGFLYQIVEIINTVALFFYTSYKTIMVVPALILFFPPLIYRTQHRNDKKNVTYEKMWKV